jgi:hypothetical protein
MNSLFSLCALLVFVSNLIREMTTEFFSLRETFVLTKKCFGAKSRQTKEKPSEVKRVVYNSVFYLKNLLFERLYNRD